MGGPGTSAPSPEALAGWALMEGPGAGTGQATTPGSVKLGTLCPLQARVPPAAAGGRAEEPLALPSVPHVETPARALVVLPPRPGDLWHIPDLVTPRSVCPSAPSVLAVHPDPTQRPNKQADPQGSPATWAGGSRDAGLRTPLRIESPAASSTPAPGARSVGPAGPRPSAAMPRPLPGGPER